MSSLWKRNRDLGFTLIEVLMAVSLVAILSTIAISAFTDFSRDAKIAVTQDRLTELKRAIIGDARLIGDGQLAKAGYISQNGAVPTALADLGTKPAALSVYDPLVKRGWRGPYVDTTNSSWNRDAWGTTFSYDSAARTIKSCGPDTTCGNADDITVSF